VTITDEVYLSRSTSFTWQEAPGLRGRKLFLFSIFLFKGKGLSLLGSSENGKTCKNFSKPPSTCLTLFNL